jgi:hypothetical protein
MATIYVYAATREEATASWPACSAPLTNRHQADRECAGLNAYWQRMAKARLAKARRIEVFEFANEEEPTC